MPGVSAHAGKRSERASAGSRCFMAMGASPARGLERIRRENYITRTGLPYGLVAEHLSGMLPRRIGDLDAPQHARDLFHPSVAVEHMNAADCLTIAGVFGD